MRPNTGVLRSALLPTLTETGVVERETGESYFDEETGSTVPVVETVYDGPVLVRPQYRQVSEEEAGGATYGVGKYDLTSPQTRP